MDIFIEILWSVSIYLLGVGAALTPDVSLVFYVGVGLFGLSCYMSCFIRKRQNAQKDSDQSDGSAAGR